MKIIINYIQHSLFLRYIRESGDSNYQNVEKMSVNGINVLKLIRKISQIRVRKSIHENIIIYKYKSNIYEILQEFVKAKNRLPGITWCS